MVSITVIQFVLTLLSTLSALSLLTYYYYYYFRKPNDHGSTNKNPPPRPAGALPIIGHLHQFRSNQLLHQTLASMADKYGPVFTVKLGSQENLIVSSWETAKECFTTLDRVFSGRPQTTATRILCYNFSMFAFAPYGPFWREMRKIATLELLSHRRIEMLSHVRAGEVQTSLIELYDSTKQSVDLTKWFGDVTLNMSVRMVGGKRVAEKGERRSHCRVLRDLSYYLGVVTLSDAIPSLGWIDLQGYRCRKKMQTTAEEVDSMMERWLEEHKQRRTGENRVGDQDFMDVLLTTLQDVNFPDFDADTICKSTCLNMILGGSDSTKGTLTWALSLLLNNPNTMKRAREEVDSYAPKDRFLEESDMRNMVYLQAVVKETLRLYPPAPLLGLRSSVEDCTISSGYHVPSGTNLLVNMWKIQRDETLWPEPLEFKPERFLTSHKDIDIRGLNFELLPFGAGRRSCPGISLGLQIVHLTLASLLQCFDVSRPDGEEIDMTVGPGLSFVKATPLRVEITPRFQPKLFGVA